MRPSNSFLSQLVVSVNCIYKNAFIGTRRMVFDWAACYHTTAQFWVDTKLSYFLICFKFRGIIGKHIHWNLTLVLVLMSWITLGRFPCLPKYQFPYLQSKNYKYVFMIAMPVIVSLTKYLINGVHNEWKQEKDLSFVIWMENYTSNLRIIFKFLSNFSNKK